MKRHIPNLLTLSRLAMAVVIFVLLSLCDARHPSDAGCLDAVLAIFLAALATDALDGWLARRLNASSTFGRISDAFVDKVLVCGTFACFLGDNFVAAGPGDAAGNVAGLRAWMVVVIFSREIFVTGIRGFSESHGEVFAATVFGKLKMFVQCLTLVYLMIFVGRLRDAGAWAVMFRDVLLWTTVALTLVSALAYVGRTQRLLTLDEPPRQT